MNQRRWAITGLAVVASLVFAVTGCGTKSNTSSTPTTPTSPPNPKELLLASVKPMTSTTFKAKLDVGEGFVTTTATDPIAKSGTMNMRMPLEALGISMTVDYIIIGSEAFVRVEGKNIPKELKLPSGWMLVDLTKVEKGSDLDFTDPDPAGLASELFKGLGTVERAGDGGFKGTLDLSKGAESAIVNELTVNKLKDKAAAVPFEAAVDGQGRITTFKVLIPAVGDDPAETLQVTYSDWGVPLTLSKPANAVPATPEVYDLINS